MLKGNNPSDLSKDSKFEMPPAFRRPRNGTAVSGDGTLSQPLTLDGLWSATIPARTNFQIVAALTDGTVEPLLWLYEYQNAYRHPFFLRKPLDLPTGPVIRGVPPGARIVLIPGKRASAP